MKILSGSLYMLLCLITLAGGTGCKKAGYLSGGSLHVAVTPLNNIDYLKANSFKLFDTATLIMEKMDMVNEVNNAKTFFAFTDYAVVNMINLKLTARRLVNPLATYTLDSLIRDINVDSIRQYMFSQTIELASTAEIKATPYTSLGKTTMGALKQLQTVQPYINMTKAPTYLLYFVKVRGAVDEPGVAAPLNESDLTALCQTTGIKTSNGATTLHVLTNSHTFVRF